MSLSPNDPVNLRLLSPQYEKQIEFEVAQDVRLSQLTEYFAEMFDSPGAKLVYSQQINSPPMDHGMMIKDILRVNGIKGNTVELFVKIIKKGKKGDVCCAIY